MPPEQAPMAEMATSADPSVLIALLPVSHPELGDILIDDPLFAIGRTEAPFDAYPPQVIDALSRRHARIFAERGHVYIADLGSKNGTTVNGISLREKPTRLKDGDEVCFGRELSYRVRLGTGSEKPAAARLVSLTLTPERADLGLQPIVIARFPFLISKSDETFGRYKEAFPHQVNYLSRRHAHIFVKGSRPYLEDLGSTNGSFVNGQRLDEHAVALQDGDVLAFGGHHFVYRVSLQREAVVDPTVTQLSPVALDAAAMAGDAERTTFVGTADSFLNIFCVDAPAQPEEEIRDDEAERIEESKSEGGRKRGKWAVWLNEIGEAFAGSEHREKVMRRGLWAGGGVIALLALVGMALYLRGAPEREVRDLLASGEYASAAAAADQALERHPDDAEMKTLGTEALLKAHVPPWIALLRAGQFDQAATALSAMQTAGSHNPDVQALVGELGWLGHLERFAAAHGKDAPIRIFADEESIKGLLQPWDADPQGHQRAFDRIAFYVPEFREFYAEALSHLRKLQSEDSVYLAAIERLKASIGTELAQDRPEVLEAILKDYAEKYPRLSGLDAVRKDLGQYLAIDAAARAGRLGRLVRLMSAGAATPPFQARIKARVAQGELPSPDILRQYEPVAAAWQQGDGQRALAGLQAMNGGPWAKAAARDMERKKRIMEQFGQLQGARDASDYDQRLLAFVENLDADEDAYFIKAMEKDLPAVQDKGLKRAQEWMARAQALLSQYRDHGALGEEERAEPGISGKFGSQARLLTEARENADKSLRLYALLKAEVPGQSARVPAEIAGEIEKQRQSLLEMRTSMEPGLLKAKLALLGEQHGEQGASP